jgi:hypothetical protein
MSKFYILITDANDEQYRCESVMEATDVARYLARHSVGVISVESNASFAVDDFMNILGNDEYLSFGGIKHVS